MAEYEVTVKLGIKRDRQGEDRDFVLYEAIAHDGNLRASGYGETPFQAAENALLAVVRDAARRGVFAS